MERIGWEDIEWPAVAVASTSASSPSPSSTTAAIGSTGTSLVLDFTLGLFVVPPLGSIVFFCALHCLRNVAPMGIVRWTYSKEEKCFKSMYSKILPRKTRKKRFCFLVLFLWTLIVIWMKRKGKHMEPPVMRAFRKMHPYIGMVCTWETGKMLWQAILNNK